MASAKPGAADVGRVLFIKAKRFELDPRRPPLSTTILEYHKADADGSPYYAIQINDRSLRREVNGGGDFVWLWKCHDYLKNVAYEAQRNSACGDDEQLDTDDDAPDADDEQLGTVLLDFDIDLTSRRELTRLSAAELRRINTTCVHEGLKIPVVGDIELHEDMAAREARLVHLAPAAREELEDARVRLLEKMRADQDYCEMLAHHVSHVGRRISGEMGARRTRREDGEATTSASFTRPETKVRARARARTCICAI